VSEDRLYALWESELDRLELDVLRAERLLKGLNALPAEPWDPPHAPGQLPADLIPRAQHLLDRQVRARADLQRALASAQKQMAYGDRVTGATATQAEPVYLDVEA
jgi:hypothetical protein